MSKQHMDWMRNHLKDIYKTPILENFLGFQIEELEEGKATYKLKIDDKHCNIYGYIHGGTLASISDVAMGVSCVTLGKLVVTIDMSISYIRNVTAGSTLTAIGKVISDGKTIMRATGQVYDENMQLLVNSQASYYVTGDYNENTFTNFNQDNN